MATIHFSSGKTREINEKEFDGLPVKLQQRGIRLMVDQNDERKLLIPLNSHTMEFIEHKFEVVEEEEETVEAPVVDMGAELKRMQEELAESMKEVEEKKDPEEKQKEAMKELMDRSNCQHEAEKLEIWRQDTAKGSRFFPVCSFCGKRERYVKAESLSDEVKANAKLWED